MAQVLAANYAFSLDAGLCLIPSVQAREADALLERFYSVYDSREYSPTYLLETLKRDLRAHASEVPLVQGGSVTFISKEIPWGFAFPELPSTHLFSYPDLGIALINGVAGEQSGSPGICAAAILDPGAVDSQEVTAAVNRLMPSGVFTVGVRSKNATVHRAAQLVESFPYDLLLISTHCGDATGWRWTYEFTDSEGLQRTLVTDIAIGIEVVPGEEKLRVTRFERFVSLDGVDWTDPAKKERLYVGHAIRDWAARAEDGKRLEPTTKEPVERVPGSMALRMADHNYIALPQSLADGGSPIVINNACASWHRLAGSFVFANARAYIGTLFSVLDPEAQAIAERLFGSYWNKPLAIALWRAQNDISNGSVRRPYILVGCHFQRLRGTGPGALADVVMRLRGGLEHRERRLSSGEPLTENARRGLESTVRYLKEQLASIENWLGGN